MQLLLIGILLFSSCTLLEEAKYHHFANQLTPTINASLTFYSDYIRCLKKDPVGPLNPASKLIFWVSGDESNFTLTKIVSDQELEKCTRLEDLSQIKIPYLNKLTRWSSDRKTMTNDPKHGELYNFSQMYNESHYQFIITLITDHQLDILVKRTDSKQPDHIESMNQKASFYEQHKFSAGLNLAQELPITFQFTKDHSRFSW